MRKGDGECEMHSEGASRGVVVFMLIGLLALTAAQLSHAQELAPNFALIDVDGHQFWLSDFSGKTVVLDFMATWCGPCVMQIDNLVELESKFSEDELAIVSISVDSYEDPEDLKALALDHSADWTFAVDTLGISDLYDVTGIPKLVVVNPQGHIVYEGDGLKSTSFMEKKVKFALTGEEEVADMWGIALVLLIPVLAAVATAIAAMVVLCRDVAPPI